MSTEDLKQKIEQTDEILVYGSHPNRRALGSRVIRELGKKGQLFDSTLPHLLVEHLLATQSKHVVVLLIGQDFTPISRTLNNIDFSVEIEIVDFVKMLYIFDLRYPYDRLSSFRNALLEWGELNEFSNKLPRLSRHHFQKFRESLSGKINLNYAPTKFENFDPSGFHGLKLAQNFTLFDVGAFDGDTARFAINTQPHFKKIHCFEPQKKFFKIMDKELCFDGITKHNLAVGKELGRLRFDENGHMGARFEKDGNTEVDVITLDSIDDYPDCIQIDVEGAELDVLLGASGHISEHRPDLSISIYHHAHNLTEVYGYLKNYYDHFAFRMFQPGHVASVLYASSAPLTPLFRC